ncbi:MAG: hypothetical protein ACTSP3_01450 [Candidatus Heimdallarchaeaceae archaeon]
MDEEDKIEGIPKIEKTTITEEKKEKKGFQKLEEQISEKVQKATFKMKKVVNLELYFPEINTWILERIKDGLTLIIGNNIGEFSANIAKKVPKVIARDISSSYVSPKVEVKDSEQLEKIEIKPFSFKKIHEIKGSFSNIIIIFTLKKLERKEQQELLDFLKTRLEKEGQIILVEEFYPKSFLLLPFALLKEGIKTIYEKIRRRKTAKPLLNFDKTIKKLGLKYFAVKYDAQGRIRTYILTKRWGALLK